MPARSPVSILHVNGGNTDPRWITGMLKTAGFEVTEAFSGAEALRLSREHPDLIVLDVTLPDLSGLEVCRRIRDDPATASIPILYLSSNSATVEDRKVGLESGADGYLAVPVEQTELTATIRALLRIRDADEEAKISARHWRTTFDAINDGVCLLNHDGTVLRCNQTMAKLLKRPFTQIIGQRYNELIGESMGSIEVPSLDQIEQTHSREVAVIPIGERWYRIIVDPIVDDYAGLTSAVHIWVDVTEQKRTNILIAGQKRILEMIAAGSPLVDVLASLTGLVEEQAGEITASILLLREDQRLYLGAAPNLPPPLRDQLNGLPTGPYAGACGTAAHRCESVLVTDISVDPLWESMRDIALQSGVRAAWATPIFAKDGKVLGTFTVYYSETRSPSPRHRELVEIATQIAGIAIERSSAEEALRQRAEQLAEADRRKDEFLAMLAHELRNPLSVISNSLKLIKLYDQGVPSIQRAREVAERQVHHQVRIVDDLLDVSRINHGKIELRKDMLNLTQLVRETADISRLTLEGLGLQFLTDLPEEDIWVVGDNTRLAQVLENLLTNAAKFTPRGGQVCIQLSGSDTGPAVLEVTDSGIGLNAEICDHLFEPFAQADHSLDRSRGGLGLGLALVKGLIELHGGQVTAKSPGLNQGSTFSLSIPTVPAPAAVNKPPAASKPKGESLRVLVVEDNPDASETMRDLLQLFGHEVEIAASGISGVDVARTFKPDVVLCDLGLPGMDGYAVAAALREDPMTASTYLVAVSGYGQDEDQRRSREAGFNLHLTKPVDVEDLQRLLEELRQ